MYVNGSSLPSSVVFSWVEFNDLSGKSLAKYTLQKTEMDPKIYTTDLMMLPDGYFYVKVRTCWQSKSTMS